MKTIILYIIAFLITCQSVLAQESEKNWQDFVKAEIQYVENEDDILINAYVINESPVFQELNYLLVAQKKDTRNNLSMNKQSGKFVLKPKEDKTLSSIVLNTNNQSEVKVYLFVKDENTGDLISKDTLVLTNKNYKVTEKSISQSNFMLSGLVIDESKTKVGRDFYDEFYSMYQGLSKTFDFTVIIKEFPVRGRNSRIEVYANDYLINEFFGSPNETYLKEYAVQTIRQITKLYQQNQLQQTLKF